MRELKFRAWDGQQMLSWDVVRKEHLDGLEDDLWQWMQFTGLTDRHGVEIYEGDILQCRSSDGAREGYANQTFLNVVEFFAGNGSCGFRFRNKRWHRRLSNTKLINFKAEIIGNVHEHAHLLEQPQPDASGKVE